MNRFASAALLVPVLAGLVFGQDPVRVPPEQEVQIQLNNISLEQFVQSVSKRTKKTFLYGDPIAQILKTAKVQLIAFKDFSDRDALFSLFQSMLQMHGPQPGGLVLVRTKPDEYKIMTANDARRAGPPVVTEIGDTPNDSFVTRIFNLQYITAQEAFTAFVNLVTPAAVAQFPGAQMIVVTDTDYNIKKCEDVIKAIDVKKPDMIWRVVPLKQAVASDVEVMLRNLLQGIGQAGRQRQPGIPTMAGAEQPTVVADRRTNSVLIFADPARIDQVQQLVESLDREPEFETSGTFLIPLRHRDASDIARILNGLYRISTDATTGLPSGGSTSATVKPGQTIGPAASQPGIPQQSFQSSSSQQPTGSEPTILADLKTNSIVLVTDRNTYQMLARLVQRLDRRRPQVLIKASVVEVQASETFDLGTELARAVDPDGITTTFARTNMGYSALTLVGGVPSIVPADTPGVTLAVLKDRFGNIPLLFKALEDKAKFTVIDEPEVACEDNGEATISISSTVQIQQATTTTGVVTNSFVPLTAETKLTIKPHITQGGYLRLETQVTISKFGAQSATLAAPPPVNSRSVSTPFQMAGGRTAVIGGIVSNDRTDSETQVPLLGDIPVFGFLFKRVRQVDVKRTLYVFITPYILYDESFGDLKNMTQARLDEIIFDHQSPDLVKNLNAQALPDPRPRSVFQFPKKERE